MTALDLSLVIPVYNEEANVEPLYVELTEALAGLGIDYEMVFVEDGRADSTLRSERVRRSCRRR